MNQDSILVNTPLHWETPFMRVQFRPELGSVDEIWLDYAEDFEIYLLQIKVVEIVFNSGCHSYIADMTHFKGAAPSVIEWMNNFWWEFAYNCGVRNLGMVVPPDIFGEFSVENVLYCEYARKINSQKFKSYEEAAEWIKQYK